MAFKNLFKAKTRTRWDHRLDKLKQEEDAFVYTPPRLGWPRGVMPTGWAEGVVDLTGEVGAGNAGW